ncbi:23 kDa integral membrane protein-like [Styela clava]
MDTWIRYFHVILNVLFILVGLVLVAFGVYVLVGSPVQEVLTYVSGNMFLIYAMIAIGGIVFLVGSCGALGSCYESKCLLMTYLTVTVIFVLAQIAVVIFAVVEQDHIKSHLSTVWYELNNETKHLLQDRFSCCGYSTPDEWGGLFPESCLNTTTGGDGAPWSTTCYNSVVGFFDENIILAGSIAGLMFLLEVFQMIVTCFMVRELNNISSYRRDSQRRNSQLMRGYDESEGDAFEAYLKRNEIRESRQ